MSTLSMKESLQYDYRVFKISTTFYALESSSFNIIYDNGTCANVLNYLIGTVAGANGLSIFVDLPAEIITGQVTVNNDYITLDSGKHQGSDENVGAPRFDDLYIGSASQNVKNIAIFGFTFRLLDFQPGSGFNVYNVDVYRSNFRPNDDTNKGIFFGGAGYTHFVKFWSCTINDWRDQSASNEGAITGSSTHEGNGQIYFINLHYYTKTDNTTMMCMKAAASIRPCLVFVRLFIRNPSDDTGFKPFHIIGTSILANLKVLDSDIESQAGLTVFTLTNGADTCFHCIFAHNRISTPAAVIITLMANAVVNANWWAGNINGFMAWMNYHSHPTTTRFVIGVHGRCANFYFEWRMANNPKGDHWSQATILNGNATIVVAHGLYEAPTNTDSIILVTGSTADTNALYVDTVGAVNFTIHAAGVVGGDRTVYWYAVV